MRLGRKQEIFTEMYARMILHMVGLGYEGRLKEVLRTKEQAEIYHRKGVGILNSNHRNGVAGDIYWSKDGELLWDGEAYKIAGNYWKGFSDNELEFCWGGDFRRRDVYHYSIKHAGVV